MRCLRNSLRGVTTVKISRRIAVENKGKNIENIKRYTRYAGRFPIAW